MNAANTMLMLVPDTAMPLLLLGVAVLMLVGIVRPRSVAAIALGMLIVPMIADRAASVLDALPVWFVLLVGLMLVCSVVRGVLALFLGAAGASHAMAILFIGASRLGVQAIVALMRGAWWMLARLFARRAPRDAGVALGTPVLGARGGALVMLCLVAPVVLPAQAKGRIASSMARSALRSGGQRVGSLLARDARRDAMTAMKRLAAPRRVFRYVSSAAVRLEKRVGFKAGAHFTSRAIPGRPLSRARAWLRYGLPRLPGVRQTVTLARGTAVRFNRALGGGRGVGEISVAKRLPVTAIDRTVRLPR